MNDVQLTVNGDHNNKRTILPLYEEAMRSYREKDYRTCVDHLRTLVDMSYAPAQSLLGEFYQSGMNVVQIDLPCSISLLQQAADQSNTDALCNLGLCYKDGDGVPPSKENAQEYLKKAASMGHPYAIIHCVGMKLIDQKLLPFSANDAFTKLIELATGGNVTAMFRLGVCYTHGKYVEKDYQQAVYWFELAAKEGHALAMNNLGMRYIKGEGVPRDISKAVEYLKRAAYQGNPNSENNLGMRYLKGEGVPKNIEFAIEWFRKAATKGNVQAQSNLGDFHRNGTYLSKNLRKAHYWYSLAAANKNTYAKQLSEDPNFLKDLQQG